MKHLKLLWTAIVFGVLPFSFTSCDDPWDWDYYDYYGDWYYDYNWYDDAFDELRLVANTLRGHWEGTMRNEYTDNTGHRVYVDMYVYFEFDQYNSRSLNGRGREIDTVGDESQELRFSWYIDPRSGDIHIRYDDSGYTFVLDSRGNSQTSGFSLTDDYFHGVTTMNSSSSTACAPHWQSRHSRGQRRGKPLPPRTAQNSNILKT